MWRIKRVKQTDKKFKRNSKEILFIRFIQFRMFSFFMSISFACSAFFRLFAPACFWWTVRSCISSTCRGRHFFCGLLFFFYVHLIIRVRALSCVCEESRTTVPIVSICSVCTLHNGARWNAIPRCIPFLPLFNSFLKSLPTEFRQQTTIGTKSSLVPIC